MAHTHKALRGGGTVDDSAFLENSAFVHATASVGARSYLGNGVYVEAGIVVGTDCIICDRVRVTADVPDGTTITCDCCGDGPTPGGSVLEFDSINYVGTKLATYVTTGKLKGTIAYVGNDTFPGQGSVQDYFSLRYGEGLTPDGLSVVNSPTFGVDGAQWVRQNVVNQNFINQGFLSVDPQNVSGLAHDENSGFGVNTAASDLVPLVSMQELNRRLIGYKDTPVKIHIMSAPDAATWYPLLNLGSDSGTQEYVEIFGTLTPIDVGGTNVVIASHTLGNPITGGAGTERTITITGLGTQPQYVGKLVWKTDGSRWAVVSRQVAPDVFALSEVCSPIFPGVWTTDNFADGDHVTFFDATALPGYPLPPNNPKFSLIYNFRIDAGTSGVFTNNQVGTSIPFIYSCIIGSDDDASDCHLLGGGSGQSDCAWLVGCSLRKRRVYFSGSWNWASCCVCLAEGSNQGEGPRLSNATIFINGELTIAGTGNSIAVYDNGISEIVPQQNSQISTWGLDGWAINLAIDGVNSHANCNGVFLGCVAPFYWYGDCPLINPDTGSLHTLFQFGQGISRIQYDPTRIVVTIGGTQLRVKLVDRTALPAVGHFMDFADCPISTLDGAFLGG